MTTLTLRRIKDEFIVTGSDVAPDAQGGQGLVHDALPRLAHQGDWGGRVRGKKQDHAAERAYLGRPFSSAFKTDA